LLSDLWNKVLSHLLLVFDGYRLGKEVATISPVRYYSQCLMHLQGPPSDHLCSLQEKVELEKHVQTLTQTIQASQASQTATEQHVAELEAQMKLLRKQNDQIMQTFSCAICFENLLENNPVALDCGHLFCKVRNHITSLCISYTYFCLL